MSEPAHRCGPFAPQSSPARARLREATIALVLERGLEGVEAAALCERAGFDEGRFEREFGGVGECALQVYLANIAEFDRTLDRAADPAAPWRERLRASAYAAARHVRARPLSTRFDMVAMLAAGDLAQAHRDRYVRRIVALIDEGRAELADPGSLGPSVAEGVFGSIYQLLARELVREGGTGGAEAIVPQLMYIAVRPYLGEQAAREELAMPPPPQESPEGPAGCP
jgi:AcrR family transcriptional regulator